MYGTNFPIYGVILGVVYLSHDPSAIFAILKPPDWQINHIKIVTIDVGSKSLGILLNALFAIPLNAASWFPAANCLIGLKAHTYPVIREKMDTPIRPWTSTRNIGYWRNRGAACSSKVDLNRSSSNARARWVTTTRRDAMPRRP